ncbi:hypothetical protein STEG23_033013, partial [Scotinomys teguina]
DKHQVCFQVLVIMRGHLLNDLFIGLLRDRGLCFPNSTVTILTNGSSAERQAVLFIRRCSQRINVHVVKANCECSSIAAIKLTEVDDSGSRGCEKADEGLSY